jgi:large subunit ribosomal protein L35
MTKLKTHSGASKRFRRNANGRIKVRRANRNHILTKVRTKTKRHARNGEALKACDLPAAHRLLNGC